jgi:multimeric flavodoxin WrbA
MTDQHIIALNGSPRKRHSNTGDLLDEIAALIPPQLAEVSLLNLADYEIKHCLGCQRCILRDVPCPQEDDAERVLSQIREADGLILSSPVYMLNVTGKLKSLIDRSASWFHRPVLVGKPALVASSTAGSGLKETLDYLEKVIIQWGAHPTDRIGRSLTKPRTIEKSNLSRFLWHLRHAPDRYRPSLQQLIFYQVQKVVALKTSPVDRTYWEAQGWDEAIYYHPCRIGPLKRVIAAAFYWMLYRRVEPVKSNSAG